MTNVIDFTQVDELDNSPPPAGHYHVEVAKAEATESKSSGNPMIKLQLRIVDTEYAGRMIFDNLVFTEKTFPFVKATLNALGLTSRQMKVDLDNLQGFADKLVNRGALVRTAIREQEGYAPQADIKAWSEAEISLDDLS